MEHQWKYEDYSLWSRNIAKNYSLEVIEKEIGITNSNRSKLSNSHLNAIKGTNSINGNSQRRAQSRNSMVGNYERFRAYSDALELYEFYPEKCKQNN